MAPALQGWARLLGRSGTGRARSAALAVALVAAAGCAARRIGPPTPPAPPVVESVRAFEPNRCSGPGDRSCGEDGDCREGEVCLGVLTTNAAVDARDGGHSVAVGSRLLWLFGDTISGDEFLSSTAAWGEVADPQRLHEAVGEGRVPLQLYPFTPEEIAFNDAHADPPPCCEEHLECPPDDRYCRCPAGTDCVERIALWPGDGVVLGDGTVLLYYEKFFIGVAPYDFRFLGVGTARLRPGADAVVRRDRGAGGAPLVLFDPDEPRFARLVEAEGADGRELYLHAVVNREGCTVDVLLARVPLGDAAERQAYRFWDGERWVSEVERARPVLRRILAGVGSIAWNDHLGAYLSAQSDICTGGAIHLRAARRLEGPWSDATEVDLSSVGGDSEAYYALLHPALGRGRDVVLSYFQFVDEAEGQMRLVAVRLAGASSAVDLAPAGP